MVYKKYIRKNGKLYGPYEYHSKRVDGKVVTEYHGAATSKNYKSFLFVILGILLISVFAYVFIHSDKEISGKAVLDLNADYKGGEILKGKLDISLKKGELIPADSKIIFENSGNSYEFNLRDIVSDDAVQGDFYIEGKDISGSGGGYGQEGKPVIYPDVFFKLNIYLEEDTETSEMPEIPEEIVEEENASEEIIETPAENPETAEQVTETSGEIAEATIETFAEETLSEVTPETPIEKTGNSPITGDAIGRFFSKLGPTGRATLELKNEIGGIVSKNKDFVYELNPGESAELEPLSVKTSSKDLDDNTIKIKREDNKVIVTTDYSERPEKGFGSEFLEDNYYKISINLDELNLDFQKGELDLKIVYNGEEILRMNTILVEGNVDEEIIPETPEEVPEEILEDINETIQEETNESINESMNETNETLNEKIKDSLTEEERNILMSEFGNTSVEVVKSELFRGRIIIGYRLGNYGVEYSYDSDLNEEVLESEMEKDRIKWLKDIAVSLIQEESTYKEINISNYSFGF